MTFLKDANGTSGLSYAALNASVAEVSGARAADTTTLAETVTFPRSTTATTSLSGAGVLNAVSTANFAASGKVFVNELVYTYTSKTSTTFVLSGTLSADVITGAVVLGVITVANTALLLQTRNGFLLPNGSIANYWTVSGNELRGVSGGTGTHATGAVITQTNAGLRHVEDLYPGFLAGPNYRAFTEPSDNDHKKDIFDFFLTDGGRLYLGQALHVRTNGDPPEVRFERTGGDYNMPDGPPGGIETSQNLGKMVWLGAEVRSDTGEYLGFRDTAASMYVRAAEDFVHDIPTDTGHVGGHWVVATTPIGANSPIDRLEVRSDERIKAYAAFEIGEAVDDGSHYLQFFEQTVDPAVPSTNGARLFARDDGAGKTQLAFRNTTGVQVLGSPRTAAKARARGLITDTAPLEAYQSNATLVTQQAFGGLLGLLKGDVITQIVVCLTAAGTGTVPTTLKFGLLDNVGVFLAKTANVATAAVGLTGLQGFSLTSPYTIPADGGYYAVALEDGAYGTQAMTLLRFSNSPDTANTQYGSSARVAVKSSATNLTDLTGTITLVGATGGAVYYFGVA